MKNDDLDLDSLPPTSDLLGLSPHPDGPPLSVLASNAPRASALDSASDGHLTDHLKVLYKRRWPALTAFLLIVLSVGIYTFMVTPIYQSKARLLIESDERNVVSFQQVVDEDQTKQDYYQTQYNILQSRALARKTLDTLQLWKNPFFTAADKGGPEALLGSLANLFRGGDDTGGDPDHSQGAHETAAQSQAIDRFLKNLTVSPIRNSRLVDVKYELPDPAIATAIVNALAKNYIEQNLEYKFMASKDATDWLGARLAEQRTQVEAAEIALQRYREQNDAIALEDRENIVVQKLGDLNAAVTRAKTERLQKEAMYHQLQSSQSNAATIDTFPAILANSFIQQQKGELADLQRQQAQLQEKLGDKHPDMQKIASAIKLAEAKLNGEIAKVVQSVRSEYQAALAQENSLVQALNQQKSEALSMNRKAIDYSVLDRDVQSSKQIYESLLQRAKETGIAGELKTSNIRVLDQAEQPRKPVRPKRGTNLLLGLFVGTLLGCGLAFFLEYMDSRIKTPDEIRRHLGLPSLGLLPAVDAKVLSGAYPLLSGGVPAVFSEAFRSMRTNILFSSAQEGAKSIVVTSTGPGEGKSMVASNLAVSLAQTGQRVLIIDADMRRPKAHDIFEVAQDPGLSNLLVGDAKASECVRKTSVAGLWVLTAGRVPPNPADLVGSIRFRDFLASVKQHFDWVIVDSPPVMAVTDAALIAHHATGLLFVIGAEMTSRHAAAQALKQLSHANAQILGAVLNRVDLDHNGYYYSHYYRREYRDYYQKAAGA